ncbi:MAG: orotate phosphoribosyltransferase, partial [Lachnospiraceae bacterium]|nr:orotate phosphoribosyltransferase [Lachnospiraceae bacterium]
MDESRIIKYYSRKNPLIALKVIEGHFATPNSHVGHYLDVTTMKTRANEAERIADTLKDYYNVLGKPIDTIVCFEGMEVIGAFLASNLTRAGVFSTNAHKTIYVMSPEFDGNGQQFFRDNLKPEIYGKNILLLLSSVTTGKSVRNSIECIKYYGGTVQGLSAIFSALDSIDGYHIDALYDSSDIPQYHS